MSIITIDIIKKNIPVYDTLAYIEKNLNCKIYIVGGAVRDILLNKTIKDIDITAENIDYTILAKSIAKSLKAHAAPFKDNMRINYKNSFEIDISKLRGKNIHEDLSLRDFTINNMALDLYGNFFGNNDDLNNKIIKAVFNETFDNDPVRILRCFRFVSTFGFDIHKDTLNLAVNKKHLLKNTAKERITDEIKKMFKGSYLEKAVELIKKYDILEDFTDNSNLNNSTLIKTAKITESFPLRLYSWNNTANFINSLSLSAKELKEVELYDKVNVDYINNMDNEQLSFYIYKERKNIQNIILYVKTVADKPDLAYRLETIFQTLDLNSAAYINGDILLKAGFKPSPAFSKIIEHTGFLLATGKLNKDSLIDYINNLRGNSEIY